MVFVAGVVTLSVGVLMVVTNQKGRIQVTTHLIEVPCFSKPCLFNISRKTYMLYHINITPNHCANLTWNCLSVQLLFNGRKAECKTAVLKVDFSYKKSAQNISTRTDCCGHLADCLLKTGGLHCIFMPFLVPTITN